MQNQSLNKKVLASLVTMSYVSLFGISTLPAVEAAPVHETNKVINQTKVYEDGSTLKPTFGGPSIIGQDSGTTDITVNGSLLVEQGGFMGLVQAQRQGNVIIKGDTINIVNNGTPDAASKGQGAGIAATDRGSIISMKNTTTNITSENMGVWATSGGNITFDHDLNIKVTGNHINFGSNGVLVSQGGSFDVKGATVMEVTGSADGYLTAGVNMWGDPGLSNSVTFNTADIKVNGGWESHGIIERGDANTLTFTGDTVIDVQNAGWLNTGVYIAGDGTVANFDNLDITANGANSNATNSVASGIILLSNSTTNFNGITKVIAHNDKVDNQGLWVNGGTFTMGPAEIETSGGATAAGVKLKNAVGTFNDTLNINVSGAVRNDGIQIWDRSVVNAAGISVNVNGSDGTGIYLATSNANLTGGLDINVEGGDDNTGMWVLDNATFKGTTGNIAVQGTNGTAILVSDQGKIVFDENVVVDAKKAVHVDGTNSSVDVKKGFISIHTDSKLIANNGGVVAINETGQGVVQFQGTTLIGRNQANPADGIIKLNLSTEDSFWNLTGNSKLTDLRMNKSVIDMRSDNNAYSTLTTATLSGSGGLIKQDIDVRTMESDKILVTDNFSGTQALDIYQKDNYIPEGGSSEGTGLVLASVKGDGTFTAKNREGTLFYNHYDLASKASTTAGFDTDWYLNKIIKLDPNVNVTTGVAAILASGSLAYHTWRTENDSLLPRMNELRQNGTQEKGAWFKVGGSQIGYGGKFGFENKYTTYEFGYDKQLKHNGGKIRYLGAALSYTDGSSSYSSGSGDNSNKAISFYSTDIGSKGHYLDLVFKVSKIDNKFNVYDTNNAKITGDFNNTGISLSAGYGRKNDLKNGWFIEPKAQITLGYLSGDDYTTGNGIEVDQSNTKSVVGSLGFNIGKQLGSKGIVYAKANLLHEFAGDYEMMLRDNSGILPLSDSYSDTWLEYGIGAAFATGKSSHLYFDVERSAGSDFTKDWQWNVGARWMF